MHFLNIQVVCHVNDKQGGGCLLFYFFIILVPVLSMHVINTGQSFCTGFRCKACMQYNIYFMLYILPCSNYKGTKVLTGVAAPQKKRPTKYNHE